MQQAEYIKAFTIAVDKVPKHKEYPSLKSDRGDLNRLYHALKVKITNNGVAYDKIKEDIKEDNLRSGVCPEKRVSASRGNLLLDLPSVPSDTPLQQSTDHSDAVNDTGNPGHKTRPIVHPKPPALHGKSMKPAPSKPSPDLVARFAKLRDSQESRSNSSLPLVKPTDSQSTPLPYRFPLSVHSALPTMPKVPDAIYSPARGTVTSEAAELPSSTPRGMFSRTNSVVSVPGTCSRASTESILRTFNGEQFVTAHTYGDLQASPTRNLPISEGELITVEELSQYMDDDTSADSKILLIDLRDRQSFDEGHITSQNTICLDPTILSRQNISASEIVDSMILAPTSEKLAFERRNEFDLVVFYDQDSEFVPQRITGNLQETIIFNLRQALIHYSFPKELAHAPKLLVGGLDAWVGEKGQQSLQTSKTQSVLRHATSTSTNTRQRLRNRTLEPEEVNTFEAIIGRDETGDFDYAKSREDFIRRFPSLKEPESMVSNEQGGSSVQSAGSSGEEFLKDISPVPPVRPKPSVARTRYSGLESADEHSPSGGVAMMAAAVLSGPPTPKDRTPTGLVNPQVWCYANSSIQALLVCRPFIDEFLNAPWPVKYRPNISPGDPAYNQLMCRILGNLFQWLASRTFVSMKATTLMHYLRTIHRGYQTPNGALIRFGDPNQHDSDEFLTFIFGQLEVETRFTLTQNPLPPLDTTGPVGFVADRWGNRPSQTVISRYWYLTELHTLTCKNCGARNFISSESERYAFPVSANTNNGTLEDLIKDYFTPEEVPSDCDKCHSKGKGLVRQIARLPPLLRIGLQRTDQTSTIKVRSHLHFPFDKLDFSKYTLQSGERAEIAKILGAETADGFGPAVTYSLIAIVSHAGYNLNSGHYVAYTKRGPNSWALCNDTRISIDIDTNRTAKRAWKCYDNFTPVQLYYRRDDLGYLE
ncbi:hypothetical protein NUW58_g6206 [Xylaria curta]|uniref:Uncharacterized protein n=1 Tax=Xylaria curta TaxID=42375 RepID=A0ACC1NXV1_9PEZI|nr:hypothetical protein NUW58_g6206 [Xylaria curta]